MASTQGFRSAPEGPKAPTLGVGMLGYAFMGRTHSNAYHKMPYIFWPPEAKPNMHAICGRSEEKVAEAAARFGYTGYYTDYHEMLADPKVDLFDNCGPHAEHVEPSIAALKAGKHVVCEKPLALNSQDALRMMRAAKESGKTNMCGFNYRFVPAVRVAHDLIQSGKLGKIYHFRGAYLQESIHDPDRLMTRRPVGENAKVGSLLNIGSHIIDMARYLMGEIKAVSAMTKIFEPNRKAVGSDEPVMMEADEGVASLIEFESGAMGVIEASRVATGRKNRLTWEINGSKGSVVFDLERLNELQVYTDESASGGSSALDLPGFRDAIVTEPEHPFIRFWWPRGHIIGWEHAHINELYHFVCRAAQGKSVAPEGATFEDGYRNAVICDAIVESSGKGQRVKVAFES